MILFTKKSRFYFSLTNGCSRSSSDDGRKLGSCRKHSSKKLIHSFDKLKSVGIVGWTPLATQLITCQ
jgi:hypothetical protein